MPVSWNAGTYYIVGDQVWASDTNQYYCILANQNQQPPNATYWSIAAIPSTTLTGNLNISNNLQCGAFYAGGFGNFSVTSSGVVSDNVSISAGTLGITTRGTIVANNGSTQTITLPTPTQSVLTANSVILISTAAASAPTSTYTPPIVVQLLPASQQFVVYSQAGDTGSYNYTLIN